MKKLLVVLLVLMCSVTLFADMPVEGGYLGADMAGILRGADPVYGVLVQVSPTDMPVDVYVGVGANDIYVKSGLVFTPWEFSEVPVGVYAGGGLVVDTVTDGELTSSLSGFATSAIAEVGLIFLFTEYAQLRTGYTYYGGDHAVNIGMVLGYNKNGLGVFKK